MANIQTEVLSLTPTGSSGSASATGITKNLNGFLLGFYVDYTSAPSTTDVTVKINTEALTVLTLTNTNTDGYYSVMKNVQDSTGTAISGVYNYYPLAGPITVTVAQADAVTAEVVITFYIAPN